MPSNFSIVGYVIEGLAEKKSWREEKLETANFICFEAKAHAIKGQTRTYKNHKVVASLD